MAQAGVTCSECGSSSVVEDDLYSETQLVCQDCGSVVAHGRLVADTREGTADVRYSQSTAVSKAPCRNLIKGLQRVRALSHILRLSYEIQELAEEFYRKAYNHASFIHVRLQKKEALVGCCVLVSCRLRDWPIAIWTVSGLLETNPALVGGVFQELVKVLDVEIPNISITDVLEAHCQEYKLGSGHVPEELAESSDGLVKRSVALVELMADTWIVTGRQPVPLMTAAIYLSWQSLKPTKARLRYSLKKFCQLTKMAAGRTVALRVAEMREVLVKLCQEIPWLGQGGLSHDEVMQSMEDILQHRYALMRRALRTHEESLGTEEILGPQAENLGSGVQRSTEDPPLGDLSPVSDGKGPEPPESCELRAANREPDEGDGIPEQRPAAKSGKRPLFVPPCVRHAKLRRVEAAEVADVDGDQEISDSEIDSYIRSAQEVRDYLQAEQLVQGSEVESKRD